MYIPKQISVDFNDFAATAFKLQPENMGRLLQQKQMKEARLTSTLLACLVLLTVSTILPVLPLQAVLYCNHPQSNEQCLKAFLIH